MFKAIATFFRKRKLRKLLNGKYKFRKLTTLAKAIGRSDEDTKELLYLIGARPAFRSNDAKWGLICKVGYASPRRARRRRRSRNTFA